MASGGRGDGNPNVDGEGLQRRFNAAAAGSPASSVEVASPLHKKTKREALGVRHGIGKLGEEANDAGDVEVHRKMQGTAAECATPARNPCSLGA